jgi:serine/threonine protein kinase
LLLDEDGLGHYGTRPARTGEPGDGVFPVSFTCYHAYGSRADSMRLLHYEVLEKLGQGGMGIVYKARDTHLDRFVALKILPPDKISDADRKLRFVDEAKAASALNHPNIITLHDIAQDGGADFIVMEYVDGKTLDQVIPHGGLPPEEALRYAIQITGALACAHAAGIIHRDVKPSNIMVDGMGT